MDNMEKNMSAQDEQGDAMKHENPYHRHQEFSGGRAQSGGFPNGNRHWPYGEFAGGMRGAASGGMDMGSEMPEGGAYCHGESGSQFPSDSLIGLLMQSSRSLFYCLYENSKVEEAVFAGLTDDEKNALKGILKKLLESWNEQKGPQI